MRIVQAVSARPEYFDREGQNIFFDISLDNIAPHAETERFSYTVPEGKKGMLDSIFVRWSRVQAANAPGRVGLYVLYTPQGGSGIHLYDKVFLTNAIGVSYGDALAGLGAIFSGDTIRVFTVDDSDGGLCNYRIGAKFCLFNA